MYAHTYLQNNNMVVPPGAFNLSLQIKLLDSKAQTKGYQGLLHIPLE